MFASNAILTKSLAAYGRRLNAKNYKELLNQPGVPEIVSYLKSNTHYAKILDKIKESSVHRGNLEAMLRRKVFEDISKICRFERSVGEHFYDYVLLRGEIVEILRFLRFFSVGHPEDYLFNMPDFFNQHTKIDLIELSKAKSYDDMLEIISHSPLHAQLHPFRPEPGKMPDVGMIEAVLQRYLYGKMSEITNKNFKGKMRIELTELFGMLIDFYNVRRIVRGKQFFQEKEDILRAQIIPGGRYIYGRKLNEMLGAPGAQAVLDILRQMHCYSKVLSESNYENIDRASDKAKAIYGRRMIHFSTYPAVVMASYILLAELELEDITSIIEGVRYGLPHDEIAKVLILYEGS